MVLKPQWIDETIENAVEAGNPEAIANALAHSDRLLDAIKDGLKAGKNVPPNVMGPSRAQRVRQAIIEAITADA